MCLGKLLDLTGGWRIATGPEVMYTLAYPAGTRMRRTQETGR
jgi:hypothetical protein